MKSIPNKDLTQLAGLGEEVKAHFEELEKVREEYRDKIAALVQEGADAVDNIIGQIDAKRQEAYDLLSTHADDAETYYDDKSERWQQGDAGEAYSDWKDKLRETADDLANEIENPEWPDYEVPDVEQPDWISTLTEEGGDLAQPGG